MISIILFLSSVAATVIVEHIDTIRSQVRQATPEIEELKDGFVFRYNDLGISPALTQFVDHERNCCAFLDFDIYEQEDSLNCEVILNNPNLNLDNVKEVILALFSDD